MLLGRFGYRNIRLQSIAGLSGCVYFTEDSAHLPAVASYGHYSRGAFVLNDHGDYNHEVISFSPRMECMPGEDVDCDLYGFTETCLETNNTCEP